MLPCCLRYKCQSIMGRTHACPCNRHHLHAACTMRLCLHCLRLCCRLVAYPSNTTHMPQTWPCKLYVAACHKQPQHTTTPNHMRAMRFRVMVDIGHAAKTTDMQSVPLLAAASWHCPCRGPGNIIVCPCLPTRAMCLVPCNTVVADTNPPPTSWLVTPGASDNAGGAMLAVAHHHPGLMTFGPDSDCVAGPAKTPGSTTPLGFFAPPAPPTPASSKSSTSTPTLNLNTAHWTPVLHARVLTTQHRNLRNGSVSCCLALFASVVIDAIL